MAVASPILRARCDWIAICDALPADGKGGSRGGPSNAYHQRGIAALACHWQAAFTTKPYKAQTSSLVVWQHVFVSDTPMTNWCGSSLLFTRVVKKHPSSLARQQNISPPRSLGGSRDLLKAKL